MFAKSENASLEITGTATPPAAGSESKDTLTRNEAFGNLLTGRLQSLKPLTKPVGTLTLFFSDNTIEDLWIAVAWGK